MLQIVTPLSDTPANLVTLEQAAAALGCSVRTVRRRIRAGELSAYMVDGRRMVSLPEVLDAASETSTPAVAVSPPVSDVSGTTGQVVSDMSPLVSQLQTRIAELEADRDRARLDADKWQDQAGHWQAMSQELSQRLSEVTGTLYRLTEAKALTPGPEYQERPRALWWAFWRR